MGQRQSEIIKNHMEVYWHDYASASKGVPITEAGLVEKACLFYIYIRTAYFAARYLPSSRPSVRHIPMLTPGIGVIYSGPKRIPQVLPEAYRPSMG